MGIFDIFSNSDAQQAANAQQAGLSAGWNTAVPYLSTAINGINNAGTAALQPLQQNYNTAQTGVTQLQNLLGLNGAYGSQSAMTALQNTPGYQFDLQQGNNAINAQAAATGTNGSGNQALALSNYNQGLASTTYNNYVNQLMPFLSSSNSAASGIANVNQNTANSAAGQYDTLANLGYQTMAGIGNSQANADLANYNASANMWNALGSIGSMGQAGGGTVGGNLLGSIGSGLSSGLSSILGIFSDERLKENIEPVGELYDGTNVYRYNYKGDETPRIGVMAQEIEKTRPDAVMEVGGFKAVDYGKATDLAASLARFVDDNPQPKPANDYDLSRFLEAA